MKTTVMVKTSAYLGFLKSKVNKKKKEGWVQSIWLHSSLGRQRSFISSVSD